MADSNPLTHDEEAVVFSVEGESVIGIHHHGCAAQSIGILIVVGGRQYRIGAHRQFVSLARHLSSHGYSVFRFDMRGMGDSIAAPIHFLDTTADITAALRNFRRVAPQVERIILWGLCDGASASLIFASEHADVDGVMMVNPWITTDGGLARTRLKHYYQKRLVSAGFWRKLMTGSIDWGHSATSLGSILKRSIGKRKYALESEISLPDKVFNAMARFNGTITIVISEKDLTAKEFKDEYDKRHTNLPDACSRLNVITVDADHTFSTPDAQAKLEILTEQYVKNH